MIAPDVSNGKGLAKPCDPASRAEAVSDVRPITDLLMES
jgi:hypothetical protein